jgi:Fe-S oxidoreductase/nitrate reductase gamma subunit
MLTREVFWGIDNGWLTYLFSLFAVAIMIYLLWAKANGWKKGQEDKLNFDWRFRIRLLLRYLMSQRLLDDKKAVGIAHLCVFYGFAVLFVGTVLLMVDNHFHLLFLVGDVFIVYKFFLNFFGLLALAGIAVLLVRRLILVREGEAQALVAFFLPFFTLLTGFLVEGSRIAMTVGSNPGWQFWAFPVYPVVGLFQGADSATIVFTHKLLWWLHMGLALLTIIAFGWTKLTHIFCIPLNLLYQISQQPGQIREINLVSKQFGAAKLEDFSRSQLISITACVSAGRCETHCPAFNSNKPLSPRLIMEKLQQTDDYSLPLVGKVIDEEALWACTTCGACQNKCPAMTNPVEKIIDLRRHQIMALGRMPQGLQDPMINMQKRGHPWSGTRLSRLDWAKGLDIPLAASRKEFDVLFWVGCAGAFVERNMKVSRAVVKLLQHGGIDFAVLGQEENCTCHLLRRAGNEHMYQMMARKNTAKLQQYSFNTIITACPHCYHTLKNEYELAKQGIRVVSHADFFKEQIQRGALTFKPAGLTKNVVYHDPCYYGRINAIINPPREICSVLGAELVETINSRENSFCCGGGGGGVWLDDSGKQRMNETRVKELLRTNTELIATACPFCMQMLESGLSSSGLGENVRVQDIAELMETQLTVADNQTEWLRKEV